jgi:hypothetical protein
MSKTEQNTDNSDQTFREFIDEHRDDLEAAADSDYSFNWVAEALLKKADGEEVSDVTR